MDFKKISDLYLDNFGEILCWTGTAGVVGSAIYGIATYDTNPNVGAEVLPTFINSSILAALGSFVQKNLDRKQKKIDELEKKLSE